MKEQLNSPERELPSNMSIVWHRSGVAFGEIWFRKPGIKNPFLLTVMRDANGQYDDEEWYSLFTKCLNASKKNPTFEYHLIRLDNENFVPENENNAPFKLVDEYTWSTKTMRMFGYKYTDQPK